VCGKPSTSINQTQKTKNNIKQKNQKQYKTKKKTKHFFYLI